VADYSKLYAYFNPNVWDRPSMRVITNGSTGYIPIVTNHYELMYKVCPIPHLRTDDPMINASIETQQTLNKIFCRKKYTIMTQKQYRAAYGVSGTEDSKAGFSWPVSLASGKTYNCMRVPGPSAYGFPFYPWAANWLDSATMTNKNNKGFWKHMDFDKLMRNPLLLFEETKESRQTLVPEAAHGRAYFAGFGNKKPANDEAQTYGLIKIKNFMLALESDFDNILNGSGKTGELVDKMVYFMHRLEAWQEAARRVDKFFNGGLISAQGYGGTVQTVSGWATDDPTKDIGQLTYAALSTKLNTWEDHHSVTTKMAVSYSEGDKSVGGQDLPIINKMTLGSPDIGYFLSQVTMAHWVFGLPGYVWDTYACTTDGTIGSPTSPRWSLDMGLFRPDMWSPGAGVNWLNLGTVSMTEAIGQIWNNLHPEFGEMGDKVPLADVDFGWPMYLTAKNISSLLAHMGLNFHRTDGNLNSNFDIGSECNLTAWGYASIERMHVENIVSNDGNMPDTAGRTEKGLLHSNWAGYYARPEASGGPEAEVDYLLARTKAFGSMGREESNFGKLSRLSHYGAVVTYESTRMQQILCLQYNYTKYVVAHAKAFMEDPKAYIEFLEDREKKNEEFEEAFADLKELQAEAWGPTLEKLSAIQEYADTYGKEALEDLLEGCANYRVLHMGYTAEAAVESCFENWAQVHVDVGGENVAPQRLRNQCAILALMDDLSELSWRNDTTIRSKTGMRNVVMLAHDQTALNEKNYVINALMNNPRFSGFYTLTPEKIAALNPFLKFYMVYDRIREKSGKEIFKDLENPLVIEIPFAKSLQQDLKLNGISTTNDMFKGSAERGVGAGIKTFEWNFFGKNTFAADKDIKAKLTLFFPTLGEFLKDRTFSIDPEEAEAAGIKGQKDVSFRYSDMAAYAGAVAHQTELSYTLKVSCGWVYNPKSKKWLKDRFGFTEKELIAIEHSFVNLILNKVDHTIDIRDDGTVGVTIDYIANAAGILRSKAANIMVGPNMMAYDDAAESIRQEIRDACEGTEGGGRAMASQFAQALGKVRRRMQISQNSELVQRLEGIRSTTNAGFTWDGIDPLLAAKMKEKIAENLGMGTGRGAVKDALLNRALVSQEYLAKNMAGEKSAAFDGLSLGYEKRQLQSRIFLVKLNEAELRRLSAAGPNWKTGLAADVAAEYYPNIGELAFYPITGDDAVPSGWWRDPRGKNIARHFRQAETQFVHDEAPASATGIAYLPDAVVLDSVESDRADIENPTLALLNAHDDYSKNLQVNQVDREAAGATTVEPLHDQGVQQRDRQLDPNGLGERYVYYIFLQDLIDVAFSIVEENAVYMDYRDGTNKHFKEVMRTKVVLGNLEISMPSTFKDRYNDVTDGYLIKNLGDIPISLSYFRHWMILNVVQKNRKTYYILDFIKDIIRDMVVGPINDKSCWGSFHKKRRKNAGPIEAHGTVVNAVAKQVDTEHMETFDWLRMQWRANRKKAGSTWVDTFYPKSNAVLSSLIRVPIMRSFPDADARPVLAQDSSRSPTSTVDAYEYVIFYASQIAMSRSGDINEDSGDGVYHYSIGNNKGITKKIKFTKAEAKGVREARLEQAGASLSSKAQMMDKYDVELEVYGTPACTPGTLLYIDPIGLSPLLGNPSETPEKIQREIEDKSGTPAGSEIFEKASMAGIMGIGGYYIVIESTSYIEAGKYMTKIKAMFDHFGGKAGHLNPVDPAVAKDTDIVVNCDAALQDASSE
jgi:hypothetical protein